MGEYDLDPQRYESCRTPTVTYHLLERHLPPCTKLAGAYCQKRKYAYTTALEGVAVENSLDELLRQCHPERRRIAPSSMLPDAIHERKEIINPTNLIASSLDLLKTPLRREASSGYLARFPTFNDPQQAVSFHIE